MTWTADAARIEVFPVASDRATAGKVSDTLEIAIVECAEALERLVFFDDLDAELVAAWADEATPRIEACLATAQGGLIATWDGALDRFNQATALANAEREPLKRRVADFEPELASLGIDYRTFTIARPKQIAGEMPPFAFKRTLIESLNYGQGGANIVGKAASNGHWLVAAITAGAALGMILWNESKIMRRLQDAQGLLEQQAEAAHGDMRLLATRLRTHTLPFYRAIRDATQDVVQCGDRLRQARQNQPPANDLRALATRLAMAMASATQLLATDAA